MKYVCIKDSLTTEFSGYLFHKEGQEVILQQARRLISYPGTADLNALSQNGPADVNTAQFTTPVPEMKVLTTVELIYCSATGESLIKSVPDYTP